MHLEQSEKTEVSKFSNGQIIYLILLFIAGILLRWISLDVRPVHHDESLHLMYGRYFYDWPDQQYYKYSAMLHGPLLYNALRAVYDTFGSSTWSGRAFTALLGTIFMFAPLFFRRFFSSWALVALCSAFVLSPSLIYWSRFIREDTLQMFFMAVTVIGAVYCQGAARAYVVMIGVILQFCEKENSFVSLALLLGFVVYELLFISTGFGSKDKNEVKETLGYRFVSYCKAFWPHVLISLTFGGLIYSYFYSAGFRYKQGILDGLYRESLAYWFNQHKIERIPGPFLFHFYTLNWYESVFIAFFFLHLFVFYKNAGRKVLAVGLGILSFAVLISFWEIARLGKTAVPFEQLKPWSLFNLKKPIEIIALTVLLVQPLIATSIHLRVGERALAFWGYYFWASFFTYSYLGEKVPWLSVYILLPGFIYLALFFDRWVRATTYDALQNVSIAGCLRWLGVVLCLLGLVFVLQDKEPQTWDGNNALTLMAGVALILLGYLDSWVKLYGNLNLLRFAAALCLLFTVRHAYMINFTYAGADSEYFSQVHTSKRFHNFILDARRQAEYPTKNGVKPKILADGESTWPVTWYLIDIPEYKFSASAEERKNFDFIIENHQAGAAVPEGFCSEVLPLRSWWVPDWEIVTLKSYLIYMFNRRPWSTTGSSNVTALVRNPDWQKCPRVVANGP